MNGQRLALSLILAVVVLCAYYTVNPVSQQINNLVLADLREYDGRIPGYRVEILEVLYSNGKLWRVTRLYPTNQNSMDTAPCYAGLTGHQYSDGQRWDKVFSNNLDTEHTVGGSSYQIGRDGSLALEPYPNNAPNELVASTAEFHLAQAKLHEAMAQVCNKQHLTVTISQVQTMSIR